MPDYFPKNPPEEVVTTSYDALQDPLDDYTDLDSNLNPKIGTPKPPISGPLDGLEVFTASEDPC